MCEGLMMAFWEITTWDVWQDLHLPKCLTCCLLQHLWSQNTAWMLAKVLVAVQIGNIKINDNSNSNKELLTFHFALTINSTHLYLFSFSYCDILLIDHCLLCKALWAFRTYIWRVDAIKSTTIVWLRYPYLCKL